MKRRDWPILRGIRLCSSRLDLTAFEYPTPQPKPSKFHKNKTKASHSKKGNTRLPTTADGGDGSGEETVVESDQTRVSTRKRPSEGSHDMLALGARRSSRNIQRVSCASDSANATARRHGHVKQEKDDDLTASRTWMTKTRRRRKVQTGRERGVLARKIWLRSFERLGNRNMTRTSQFQVLSDGKLTSSIFPLAGSNTTQSLVSRSGHGLKLGRSAVRLPFILRHHSLRGCLSLNS